MQFCGKLKLGILFLASALPIRVHAHHPFLIKHQGTIAPAVFRIVDDWCAWWCAGLLDGTIHIFGNNVSSGPR
jgi:hypothetical protein